MSIDVISIPMWTAVIISHLQDKQTHCDHIPIVYRTNRHIVITLLSSSGQTDTLWSHCSPSSGQTNTLWSHCSHLQDKQTHCDHIALIFRTNRHIVITLLSSSGKTDTWWSHSYCLQSKHTLCSVLYCLQNRRTHWDHINFVLSTEQFKQTQCDHIPVIFRTNRHIVIRFSSTPSITYILLQSTLQSVIRYW